MVKIHVVFLRVMTPCSVDDVFQRFRGHIAFHPEDAGSTYLPTNPHDVTYQEKAVFILRECVRALNVPFFSTPGRNLRQTAPINQRVPGTGKTKA